MDEAGGLEGAGGGVGTDGAGAEELEDADFAHVAPVVAVGAEGEAGVAVPHDAGADAVGAVGAGRVLGSEDLLRRPRGGDDDGGGLAEVEVEDGAVLLGEAGEGVVGEFAHQVVQVPDYWQLRRGWRELLLGFGCCFLFCSQEYQNDRCQDEEDSGKTQVL